MTLEEAKKFLNECERREFKDITGTIQTYWHQGDDQVAGGYFSRRQASVWIDSESHVAFDDEEARELQNCGELFHK